MNTVLNFIVPLNVWNFLTEGLLASDEGLCFMEFSRRTWSLYVDTVYVVFVVCNLKFHIITTVVIVLKTVSHN